MKLQPGQTIRQAMLDGPIVPVMLKLAGPSTVVLLVQSLVAVIETIFIGRIGTEALAGAALVFPVLGLMIMMSNGGIGGGVAAAVARAIGGGRREDADALLWHSLVLAVLFGVAFTVLVLVYGPPLYGALGGDGPALDAALAYSTWVFAFSVPVWAVNLIAAALRGAGNVSLPARVSTIGGVITAFVSPALILGLGPGYRFGIAGAGIALGLYYTGALIVLLIKLREGHAGLHLRPVRLQMRLMRDILRVGLISALSTLQNNVANVALTGAAGLFGAASLAGFGVALRLELLLLPILFGLGSALVAMVGTNVGAGQVLRARRIAWNGAMLGGGFCAVIGLIVSVAPQFAWVRMFSDDPEVLATGAAYLSRVGPFYVAFGVGMEIYFASQGAGATLTLFLAGTVRLVIAAVGGWYAIVILDLGPVALYWMIAAGMTAFGFICMAALDHPQWGRRPM